MSRVAVDDDINEGASRKSVIFFQPGSKRRPPGIFSCSWLEEMERGGNCDQFYQLLALLPQSLLPSLSISALTAENSSLYEHKW